ncbi:MAG: peptidylprolyl isomerase [Aeoliella sp.]
MSHRSKFGLGGVIPVFLAAFALVHARQAAASTVVRFDTTFGNIDVRLYDEAMPLSVANFLNYVEDGDYVESFVHRSDPGFVIQGGGFRWPQAGNLGNVPTDDPIDDEPGGGVAGISNLRGTIANAKSGPNTVTSQWFFNLGNNSNLDSPGRPDGGFAAFGRVIGDGMDVVDEIASQQIADFGSPLDELPLLDTFTPGGPFFQNDLIFVNSVVEIEHVDGDYNFDGIVDAKDYTVWRDSLGSTTEAEADGNGDGVVDGIDFVIWRDNIGQSGSGGGSLIAGQIPEPGTAVMAFMIGGVALMCRRITR